MPSAYSQEPKVNANVVVSLKKAAKIIPIDLSEILMLPYIVLILLRVMNRTPQPQ